MTESASACSVRWTEIFATIESDAFQELALLAGEVSRSPIAMVTLVDENQRWFTSSTGAQLTAGPWEQTFCSHAVQQVDLFVVRDATLDPRFAQSLLVHAPPYIRFYAGAPLLTGGRVVGTLCVMDTAARDLPSQSATGLRALARQVVTQLELRRQSLELKRLNEALAHEVVERQRTEAHLRDVARALRESQHALQEIDTERRELIANVSHDLRTPLTALQGFLDTVLMKGEALDALTQRQYLEQASAKVRRLARLVSDLFELAELDAGHIAMKPERFELAELAHDVVQAFTLGARAKRVTLRVRAEGRPVTLVGDLRLLERVLENLLHNAIRFTPEGGEVILTCSRSNDRAEVRVTDTGPGIAPADRAHLFNRFYSGRQPSDHVSATTGLGLAIARRVVELHGGTLTAAEPSEGGAEFIASLPASD